MNGPVPPSGASSAANSVKAFFARTIVDKYLRTAKGFHATDVEPNLWNNVVTEHDCVEPGEKRQAAILAQYLTYVEMADRVSARRALANTFFVTINTGVFVLIGVFWKDPPEGDSVFLLIPGLVLIAQCFAWFSLLRSYRQLNSAKYAVIGALEMRLPASPYYRAEWNALGEGQDPSRYWPLTHLEQWLPALFGLAYASALALAVLG